MIKRIRIPGIAFCLLFLWLAALPAGGDPTVYNVDRKGVALKGFDPVAYFTLSKPVKGKKEYAVQYDGATWRFADSGNRDLFLKKPERYVPQYGGYCAYAVAQGGLFDIHPDAWTIYKGKLYLNQNLSVRELWLKDIPRYIRRADLLWPKIQKRR
jgi:YHS domain-containing protein